MIDDPILDPETVTALRTYETDGIITLAEFVDIILSDIVARSKSITTALEASDAHDLEHNAHALKSTAGSIGAKGMSNICQKLENLGKSGKVDQASDLHEALKAEIPLVDQTLKDLISS